LLPLLGAKKLDGVTNEDVVEWDIIDRMPCTIRLLPVLKPSARFHDFDDYGTTVRLTEALRRSRHLRGRRVLCNGDGAPFTPKIATLSVRIWR
jgi:hypothetical protein